MKILIAPDSFKGSLTAKEVANAIERGIHSADSSIETVKVPMADGGEGTAQALVDATNGQLIYTTVQDPLGRPIEAFYGILGDGSTAIIEMATASGLPLLKEEEKNPMITSTYGTGELIKHALDRGCRKIIMGIGGSATNDGGTGMARALGVVFLDKHKKELPKGGAALIELDSIDISGLDKRVLETQFIAACDVDNPLIGRNGASHVFGPQKGATKEMAIYLDKALGQYGKVLEATVHKRIMTEKGAGAAGGLGAGLLGLFNAELRKGIDIVIDTTQLKELLVGVDLLITGEGRIDFQTQFGKTPFGVAQVAIEQGIPVIAIGGSLGEGYEVLYEKGFTSLFSIIHEPMEVEKAMSQAKHLLEDVTRRLMRLYFINKANSSL